MTRTALGYATVTLAITEYIEANADDDAHAPITKIDITQTATGGIQSSEKRTTDWRVRPHEDRIFGSISGQSRLVRGAAGRPTLEVQTEPKDEKVVRFLKGEILADGTESNGFLVDEVTDKEGIEYGEGEGLWLQSWVRNEGAGWTAEQVSLSHTHTHTIVQLDMLIKSRSGDSSSSTASASTLAASLLPKAESMYWRDWSTTTRDRWRISNEVSVISHQYIDLF